MNRILNLITIFIFSTATLWASPLTDQPVINAGSAILIDAASGRVLFEKNADKPIPPASMTKLMTIHTAMNFIKEGSVDADSLVPVSRNADFRNQPPRSSLMFIEEGQSVSLIELLQGLSLPSGNDAGVAVAEHLAGSVEAFVKLMNTQAAKLGMFQTHFDDSSGYSEKNVTTAREYASFCRVYIEENIDYIDQLHQPLNFTYPKAENLGPSGDSVHGPITQSNRNLLIGRMEGVDGLKTGYIDESGYNFAATAVSGERRLILVTMEGPGLNSYDGSIKRALDAAVLLSYGFYAWSNYQPEVPGNERVEIYGGKSNSLGLEYSPAAEILVQTARLNELRFIPDIREVKLPVYKGSLIGRWQLMLDDTEIQSGIITAKETVLKGNIFKQLFDRARQP